VDPVCHTLVGASLAQSGLKRRTALGTATLLLAANLPDIDVLAYAYGPVTALWFRRGVTHGVLAWAVLPLLLTAGVLAWDRIVRHRGGRTPTRPVIWPQVLLLAFVGVASHPLLDLLNTYGIRLLMPFSDRWFYGDTLFILDPWVWAILVAGIWIARQGRRTTRPAVVALLTLGTYVGIMAVSNVIARRDITATLEASGAGRPERMMVAPVAVNPFERWVVAQIGDDYRLGRYYWLRPERLNLLPLVLSPEPADYRATAATRGPSARMFLSWARFPYYEVGEGGEGTAVYIGDARYTLDPVGSWASVQIDLGAR
jgi:inner membrane protein